RHQARRLESPPLVVGWSCRRTEPTTHEQGELETSTVAENPQTTVENLHLGFASVWIQLFRPGGANPVRAKLNNGL
ncbi:hypothetical protein Droror1_Dr00002303, partial [Drosera rotundifolia]